MRAQGAVVSTEELLEKAWDENADPFTNAMPVAVMTLRRKLGEPSVIETVPGPVAGSGRKPVPRCPSRSGRPRCGHLAGLVWFHGDAQSGNPLVNHGRLCAVIVFGTCGIGDRARDTTIAWTFLSSPAQPRLQTTAARGPSDLDRGRGWRSGRLCRVLVGALDTDSQDATITCHR